jgi:hypothetical protein
MNMFNYLVETLWYHSLSSAIVGHMCYIYAQYEIYVSVCLPLKAMRNMKMQTTIRVYCIIWMDEATHYGCMYMNKPTIVSCIQLCPEW